MFKKSVWPLLALLVMSSVIASIYATQPARTKPPAPPPAPPYGVPYIRSSAIPPAPGPRPSAPAPVFSTPPAPAQGPQASYVMNCRMDTNKSPIVVLSIDGAAVRGLAQLKVVKSLVESVNIIFMNELRTHPEKYQQVPGGAKRVIANKPKGATEIFDFLVGTSAGAINTIGLTTPSDADYKTSNTDGKKTEPKFSLEALIQRVPETLEAAFSRSVGRDMRVAFGLLGSKFTAKPLEELLKEYAGQARMSDSVIPIAITSFDLVRDEPVIFNTFDACSFVEDRPHTNEQAEKYIGGEITTFQKPSESGGRDYSRQAKNVYLAESGRAASAAPVYYKPLTLYLGGQMYVLIDAGLFIMNPSELALQMAQEQYPGRRIVLVSIGSGMLPDIPKVDAKGATAGSIPKVLERTITTSLTGQQALTDYMMKRRKGILYHRLNFGVESKDFSDMSKKNIESLTRSAEAVTNTPEFKAAVKDIADAVIERSQKNDLPPFICKAKVRQLALDKQAQPFIAAVKRDQDLKTKQFKEASVPVPAKMQKEIEDLRADCLRLQKEKNKTGFKSRNCRTVLGP